MMSERNSGASISEIAGIYLGGFMKNVMRVFSVVLLIMVGTVFAVGPAGLIVTLFKNSGSLRHCHYHLVLADSRAGVLLYRHIPVYR